MIGEALSMNAAFGSPPAHGPASSDSARRLANVSPLIHTRLADTASASGLALEHELVHDLRALTVHRLEARCRTARRRRGATQPST